MAVIQIISPQANFAAAQPGDTCQPTSEFVRLLGPWILQGTSDADYDVDPSPDRSYQQFASLNGQFNPASQITFRFYGRTFRLRGRSNGAGFDITIDGGPVQTVTTNTAGRWATLFEQSGLSNAGHTVQISNIIGGATDFDDFIVPYATPQGFTGFVAPVEGQANDFSRFSYGGPGTWGDFNYGGFRDGNARNNGALGCWVEFWFFGRGFTVYGITDPNYAEFSVAVNDQLQPVGGSFKTATFQNSHAVYTQKNMPLGIYKVRLTCTTPGAFPFDGVRFHANILE